MTLVQHLCRQRAVPALANSRHLLKASRQCDWHLQQQWRQPIWRRPCSTPKFARHTNALPATTHFSFLRHPPYALAWLRRSQKSTQVFLKNLRRPHRQWACRSFHRLAPQRRYTQCVGLERQVATSTASLPQSPRRQVWATQFLVQSLHCWR